LATPISFHLASLLCFEAKRKCGQIERPMNIASLKGELSFLPPHFLLLATHLFPAFRPSFLLGDMKAEKKWP